MMKSLTLVILMVSLASYAHLQPYGEPPKVILTPEQKAKLDKGELVFWETTEDRPNEQFYREGTAAFRINASPEKVWKVLGNFSKYKYWSYKIAGTEEYKPSHNDQYYIEYNAKKFAGKYSVIHDFPMLKKGYGTWKTDHTRKNECVLDTVGFWRVDPVKDHPDQSDVYSSGKAILNKLCAKGMWPIDNGFNGHDMAEQTFEKIKERVKIKKRV